MPSPEVLAGLHVAVLPPGEDEGPGTTVSVSLGATPLPVPPSASERLPRVTSGEAGEEEPRSKAETQPFILSECLPPVPAKLVAKIIKGDFVDMAELLRDNIEAERRRALGESSSCPNASRPQRREVPDFMSWLQCFGTYVGIVATHKPERIKQLMAYQMTMIREARRCGGAGWQGYDTMFRQLAATTPGTDWGQLNSALYTVTFMAQQNGRGKTCQHCLETDHSGTECAMAPVRLAGRGNPPGSTPPPKWMGVRGPQDNRWWRKLASGGPEWRPAQGRDLPPRAWGTPWGVPRRAASTQESVL